MAEVAGLGSILDRIGIAGDGIIIARTSDGGAWAITLLTDAGKPRRYPSGQDELDAAFQALAELYTDEPK